MPPDLAAFERDVELAGLVGEKTNAKIVFLAAVSAKLRKPLNVNVGGASSAGKNYLTGIVARFIPKEDRKIISGMSPKVLMHSQPDEFQHKAVFIAEYEGVAGADYPIRIMQSEQSIDWEFVESSKDGIQKKKRTVKGPASFIQATTRTMLHPENETRLLFIEVDESDEQTRAINERQALEAEKKTAPCPVEVFARWHEIIRNLERLDVVIPFASQLAQSLPKNVIRSRRDFPKLLGLIEASAFLHQRDRKRHESGNIVASFEDYNTAKALFEHCYYSGPENKVAELLDAAQRIDKRLEAERIEPREFSVANLMVETGWGKSKTYQVLSRVEELGCIAQGDGRGRYRLFRTHPEPPLTLPSRIKLKAGDFPLFHAGKG
jgi:hypothetical protein